MRPSGSAKSVGPVWAIAVLAVVLVVAGCSTKSQRLYRRAEAFFRQGEYELAAREYARIVQEAAGDPLADDALYKLAYLYREELDNPSGALRYYRRLADEYRGSNYVDDALFWIVYLQRRHLRDPDMAAATCREIDQRFPTYQELRGRVHLEVARAYMEAERLADAQEWYARVSEEFSDRPSIAAQALLMQANIMRKTTEDREESLALYVKVVEQYPDTEAAAAARQAVGWAYYDEKTETEKARLERLREQARVLENVPPIDEFPGAPAMELLAALRSLLRQAGTEVSMDQLVVSSGLPFTFTFAAERPSLVQTFYRNPAAAISDQMGFAYDLRTSAGGASVLDTATGCLMNNRPLLVIYGRPNARWCLITGHRPAEKELHLLSPGAQQAVKLSADEFLRVWEASEVPVLWPQGSIAGFQFALTQQQTQPDLVANMKSVVIQASLAWDQTELMRQPAGAAAHWALLEVLAQAAADDDLEQGEKIKSWATQAVPLIISTRRAAARFFADLAAESRGRDQTVLLGASDRYQQIANRWESLGESLAQMPTEAGEEGGEALPADRTEPWRNAVEAAQELASLEGESLRWLASSLAD